MIIQHLHICRLIEWFISICVDFVYDFEGKLYKSQVLTLGFETLNEIGVVSDERRICYRAARIASLR